MRSERSHQPSACSARAVRHGMPIRSLGFSPLSRAPRTLPAWKNVSPRLSQTVPVGLSRRRTPRKISTKCATNKDGAGSRPRLPSHALQSAHTRPPFGRRLVLVVGQTYPRRPSGHIGGQQVATPASPQRAPAVPTLGLAAPDGRGNAKVAESPVRRARDHAVNALGG